MGYFSKLSVFLLLAAAAFAQAPRPPEEEPAPLPREKDEIVNQLRTKALKFTEELPNFVANQITRRNVDPSGSDRNWKLVDTIDEELSYSEHKEEYKVVKVNGKPVSNGSHDRPNGLTSSGEFASVLAYVFDPASEATFEWSNWAKVNDRRSYVLGYKVDKAHSKFTISVPGSKNKLVVGFIGLIYADAETGGVTRLLVIGQSPPGYPVQGVTLDVNYGFTKIGDQEYLLPLKSDLRLKDGKGLIWNEVEFRNYRKFGAESTLHFERR